MAKASDPLRAVFLFSVLCMIFILSSFHRYSSAVIAPNLMQDLALSAGKMGMLGGSYFYSLALLQVPMGVMLDRIGPRIVLTISMVIGASGAFLLASAGSFTTAFAGRILIGAGMACGLMGPLKVFTLEFSHQRLATYTGIILSVGTLGNILATSPLAYFTSTIGWRMTFEISGAISVVLAGLVCWTLRGERKDKRDRACSDPAGAELGVLQSIRLIFGSLPFWQIGTAAFFRFGTFVSLQGLWLGPYLIDIKRFSPVQTGNLLTLLSIGTIVGTPVAGWLSDRIFHSRKEITLCGMAFSALSLLVLIGIPDSRSFLWIGLIFFSMSFFGGISGLFYVHAKELFPDTISATAMTSVNLIMQAGGAFFMPVLGEVIDRFPKVNHTYPAQAYHFSFLICFLGMAASVIFYAFPSKVRKAPPSVAATAKTDSHIRQF